MMPGGYGGIAIDDNRATCRDVDTDPVCFNSNGNLLPVMSKEGPANNLAAGSQPEGKLACNERASREKNATRSSSMGQNVPFSFATSTPCATTEYSCVTQLTPSSE